MTTNETRTRENIINEIISYFEENESIFNEAIEELDGYNGYLGDGRYYYMDELNEIYNGVDPIELLYRVFYGKDEDTDQEFNPNREFFKYNGYGNLISADYKDYSGYLDHYFINDLLENRNYIYSIENDIELCRLFDELEEVEN